MDKDLLAARVRDACDRCFRADTPVFLGFLSETEATLANDMLKGGNVRFEFSGGFENAERVYLACLPDWCKKADYPILPLSVTYNKAYKLTHRDFLGAVLALGIERDKIGDIIVNEGEAVIFAAKEIALFIKNELEKVGRVGVTVSEGINAELKTSKARKEFCETIASARLDCVIAALCKTSRNKAADIINAGFVSVNSRSSLKLTLQISSGDKISVRGKGKFFIESTDEFSKKGRIILKYSKYI